MSGPTKGWEKDVNDVHPYFVDKARAVFRRAEGDPDRAGALAAWAQAAQAEPNSRRRVLVAEDGTLVAEARHVPGRVGAAYITSVADQRDADLVKLEVGLAAAQLGRRYGQSVIVVTYSDVCSGQAVRRS
jgi:hypothetical protein